MINRIKWYIISIEIKKEVITMTKELKAKLMDLTIDELDQWANLNAQKEEANRIAQELSEQLDHYRQLVIDLTNQMNDIVQK